MIKAIIFDCFGVIISDALSVIVSEVQSKNPEGAEEIHRLVGLSNRGIIDPVKSSTQVAHILGISLDEYRQRISHGEIKDQRVLDFIYSLREKYKIAMLSNIGSSGLERRFTKEELDRYFDVVVASGQIGYAKPEVQAYEITAQKLGVRLDECIFIDDRSEYCEGARQVGMRAIVYLDFSQLQTELEQLLKE